MHCFAAIRANALLRITIAEMKFGAECAQTAAIRQQRLSALAKIRTKPVVRIDELTGEIFGSLAAQMKMSGTTHRNRVQDIWLASQAIQHGLTLLNRNPRDFKDIPGLQMVRV
jgi:predicted nucleic acid-binding protein